MIISIPGSKSYTNRALLLAALAQGESTLHNVLISDDTNVMITALRDLGVLIDINGTTAKIKSTGTFKKPLNPLYLGNAGTAVRFLTALLSHQSFDTKIVGTDRMHQRPILDLIKSLEQLGASIEHSNGCPPLTIHGKKITENQASIIGKNSSQYISALMMLAPLLENGLTIEVNGEITSKPYLDMTLDLMNKFIEQEAKREGYSKFVIPHQIHQAQTLDIESDASSASYFFGLAAITGKELTIDNITRKTLQPDIKLLNALEKMGCKIVEQNNRITITGPQELKALGTLNANDFPDAAMTLSVISAFAKGETTLTGLQNLRIKESDRLAALHKEMTKIGVSVKENEDGLTIIGNPNQLHGATIETYDDHRIAMCFGMAQVKITDIHILNPDCVNKTFPEFWETLTIAND
jgi:3-phosphoshikimate 1-carboxyvinyltransferase